MTERAGSLDRGDGVGLAWQQVAGQGTGVVFLGGFRSDMTGAKAEALFSWCEAAGHPFLRLDYSGHGASGGRFEDGTIGIWARDAACVLDALAEGPQVIVGSSMGGWIALLLALGRVDATAWPRRWQAAALVGIAAAPDFTPRMAAALAPEAHAALARDGVWLRPSAYGDPIPITRALIADGARHCVLDGPMPFAGPVRLLHGQRDPDVPWTLSLTLAETLGGDDVQVLLVKDGDHRLSRPADLDLLCRNVGALLGEDRF